MAIVVKYNDSAITPTPLVSRSYQFIDYGTRFGQVENIDLSCYLTGITSYQSTISNLNTTFAGQFKTLEIFNESGISTYKWDNLVLQEINIPNNKFNPNGFATYNAKFVSYQIPSGVLDPINEYSFSQSEDGTVSVNHKISARGIRTSLSPLDNAINFVTTFTRQNPFSKCPPTFIPNSSGVLMNISESIDRTNGTYSVNELYKYTTGSNNVNYLKTTSLDIEDSTQNDYRIINVGVKIQGSPVNKNLSEIQTAAAAIDFPTIIQDYGLATTNIYRDSFNLTQNSGENSIELKANYISGLDSDLSGYFDYTISVDYDVIQNQNNYKIDGEYISKGPLNFKQNKISTFKTTNGTNGFIPYLSGLLIGSPIYALFDQGFILNNNINVSLSEDTGNAILRLSASFNDADKFNSFTQSRIDINVEPSKWVYETMQSANIEGAYVLQDLQMRDKAKIRIGFDGQIDSIKSSNISAVNTLLDTVSGAFVQSNSFLVSENITSGINSLNVERAYIGEEIQGKSFLTAKAFGSLSKEYVRTQGFKFGY